MKLKDYASKRHFEETPEPRPGPGNADHSLVFVVQKHAARALHYDLRLQMEGVLKSWAIPKGPSLNPASKRLAVMVEDHPFDYRDFEGMIPEGNYGAGSVIVWDRGSYRHPSGTAGKAGEGLLLEGLKKGDLKFILEGEKLRGEFALVKTRKDEKSWLLIKKRDRFATTEEILAQNRSVLSGKTLEETSGEDEKRGFRQKGIGRIRQREALEAAGLRDAPTGPMPRNASPMLATLIREPFDHPDWIFEVKWDGYRAMAEIENSDVTLRSRNGLSFNRKFPAIVEALGKFGLEALLDGEIVVVDDQGNPDFQMMQDYAKSPKGHLLYCVFDLLHLAGRDLTALPLIRRKELLKKILPPDPHIRFSDHVTAEGILFFRVARERGLEGIMAKHSRSVYKMGARSRQWLKIKTRLVQEGVIAGFTEPRGRRNHFGALVLGVYSGDRLVYIGHTGGGFGTAMLGALHKKLSPLIRKKSPFAVEPATNGPVTWVKPVLVCEVAFQGWTDEGLLRQPVFLRLREDKEARDVVREEQHQTAPTNLPPGNGGERPGT